MREGGHDRDGDGLFTCVRIRTYLPIFNTAVRKPLNAARRAGANQNTSEMERNVLGPITHISRHY